VSKRDGSSPFPVDRPPLARWWSRRRQLKKRRLARMTPRQRFWRRIGVIGTWALGLFALGLSALAIFVYKIADVPQPNDVAISQTAQVMYSDGSPMATVGAENRTIVPLSRVPQHVRDAVLAAEDRTFYKDPGVSLKGTLRAAINDITGGDRQGGSGITQQYVKNAYTDASPTLGRKLKELTIALKLSREYSKDEILEYYLNTIYWGRDNTYGIAAAAQAYFGVSPEKLTVAQGALLAGIIKAPNTYDPRINAEAAGERYRYVLDGMESMGVLSAAERGKLALPTTIALKQHSSLFDGPLGMVWRQVKAELPPEVAAGLNTHGLRITTTIDRRAQSIAQNTIHQNWETLTEAQRQTGMRPALVAVNPSNGAVIAYYGGSHGTDFDYANGYSPPGSSFKPFTLAAALQMTQKHEKTAEGQQYTISSTFDGSYCVKPDGVTEVCNDPGLRWSSGITTLRYATEVSLNTTFVGLAEKIGPDKVRDMAWAAGISKANGARRTLTTTDGHAHFGIGIGDSDYKVRPIDQAVGFATFADGGVTHKAFFVSKVTDSKGHVVYEHKDRPTRAMDPKVANDVSVALRGVAEHSGRSLANGRESGSKTGTAGIEQEASLPQDYWGKNSDAWMVGYTPQVSTAVWVGTGKVKPIYDAYGSNLYGANIPGIIWKTFMDAYLEGQPNQPMPYQQEVFAGSDTSGYVVPSQSSTTPPASSSTPTTSAPATTAPKTTPRSTPTPKATLPTASTSVSVSPLPTASTSGCRDPILGHPTCSPGGGGPSASASPSP